MAATNYDEIDRFLVFVEQLEVACELLEDGALGKVRAALVGIDNLANVLLHAHAKAVFRSGEGARWDRRKRYSSKDRRKILNSFDRMATLAAKEPAGPGWRRIEPILSNSDAAVMRVGHTYRNGVYHEDRHNSALLTPLTALYAQAVGRAFCCSHRHGWSIGVDAARAERLATFGYEPAPDRFTPSARMLNFGVAAPAIVESLTGQFTVDEQALREWLAADIVQRTAWCAGMLVQLLDDGMEAERVEWAFFWTQFWAEHGADETWLALEHERDELSDALHEEQSDFDELDPRVVAYREADAAYIARAHELQRGFKPAVQWGDAPRLGKLGKRLEQAIDIASLLARYGEIDKQVELLENATIEAVRGWDQAIDDAIDRAREA